MAKWRTKKTASAGGSEGTEAIVEKKGDNMTAKKDRSNAPVEEMKISAKVHCEGCAKKLRRSLQRLDGVEEVTVDYWSNTVVLKLWKELDNPEIVVDMVERKTGKKAVLLSRSPVKLPSSPVKGEDTKKVAAEEKAMTEQEMKMVVMLRMDLHCDACTEEVKRRILRIKGVAEAVPDMKSSQVMVKGTTEPATLVGFIHKCTGRKAAIVRAEPLDPLPPQATDAPSTETEAPAGVEKKQQDTSDNAEEKMNGSQEKNTEEKMDGIQEDNRGEGEEDDDEDADETIEMEKPNEGNEVKEGKTQLDVPNEASNRVAEENHNKDAPEDAKIAVNSHYQYYYHPAYTYAYPHYAYQQYQYPHLNSYAGTPTMYTPYPSYPPPETGSHENPEACNIM